MTGVDLPATREVCTRCGHNLGDQYEARTDATVEIRQFFYRDCPACGTQHLVRMVKTWT